jgi:glycerol-3-phosphate cytidylyltransferase
MKKKVLVDMSVTLLHHGHIRLLKKASKIGTVYVGLSSDADIKRFKGYKPELKYKYRKEILESIKFVSKVVKVNYHVTDNDLKKYRINALVHGNDLSNHLKACKAIVFKRTKNISSSLIRKKSFEIYRYEKIRKKMERNLDK